MKGELRHNFIVGENQTTRVEKTPEGQIRIVYDRIFAGQPMCRELVCQATACEWLIDHLSRAADDNLPDTDASFPPDQFRIYTAGGHGYDDINVSVSNERDENVNYGAQYLLYAMEPATVRKLVEQLRLFGGA